MPTRGHSPLIAASHNANRLVLRTLRDNTAGVVVNVNNDTAGSNNTNVMRTLKTGLYSTGNGRVNFNNNDLGALGSVSVSNLSPHLGSYIVHITYSIAGPLINSGNTSHVFNPRGKTDRTVVIRLSGGLSRCTSIVGGTLRISIGSIPNTKTTNNVNTTLVTFLNTRLGDNVRVIAATLGLRRRVRSYALIVANRKHVSDRDVRNGMPVNITGITGGCRGPIVNVTNDLASSINIMRRRNVSTIFDMLADVNALSRTFHKTCSGVYHTSHGVTTALTVKVHGTK